jgi:hypothetical protein
MFHKDRIAELEGRDSSPTMNPQVHESGDKDLEEEVYCWHGNTLFRSRTCIVQPFPSVVE